jgi:hypothetical protein
MWWLTVLVLGGYPRDGNPLHQAIHNALGIHLGLVLSNAGQPVEMEQASCGE